MKIGAWLYEYRKKNKLSMQDVADRCGFSRNYVFMLEKGVNNKTGKAMSPTVKNLTKIADMAGITLDKLIQILDDDQTVIVRWEEEKKKPLSAREFMRIICKGDPEALAIVERLQLSDDGNLEINGADAASQAVLEHQVKGLISALKNAKIQEDGKKHFTYSPKGEKE